MPSPLWFEDPESDDTLIVKPLLLPNWTFLVLVKVCGGPDKGEMIPNFKDGPAGFEDEEDVPKSSKIRKTLNKYYPLKQN